MLSGLVEDPLDGSWKTDLLAVASILMRIQLETVVGIGRVTRPRKSLSRLLLLFDSFFQLLTNDQQLRLVNNCATNLSEGRFDQFWLILIDFDWIHCSNENQVGSGTKDYRVSRDACAQPITRVVSRAECSTNWIPSMEPTATLPVPFNSNPVSKRRVKCHPTVFNWRPLNAVQKQLNGHRCNYWKMRFNQQVQQVRASVLTVDKRRWSHLTVRFHPYNWPNRKPKASSTSSSSSSAPSFGLLLLLASSFA